MAPIPRKLSTTRPPTLAGSALLSGGTRPAVTTLANGRMSFLGSLGFHGCLLAAACSIPFLKSSDESSNNDETAGKAAGFEMISAAARLPKFDKTVSNASPLPQPSVPIMLVNSSAACQLPPQQPMSLVSDTSPKAAAAPAATGKPSNQVDHHTSKSSGRKGAGRGEMTKLHRPVPPPRLVSAPPPTYPAAARAAHKSGKVGVLVRVRGNGSAAVASVYQSSGHPQLDQAAVAAARSWKFSATPSLGPGATVAVVVQVSFKL